MNPKQKNDFAGLDRTLARADANVRRRGLLLLAIGLAGIAVVFAVLRWIFPALEIELDPKGIMVASIPGALGLLGLLELVRGVGYGEWAHRWDSLRGWQRGVLGVIIVCAFFGIILGIVAVAF